MVGRAAQQEQPASMDSGKMFPLILLVAGPAAALRLSLREGQPCQLKSGAAGTCQVSTDCPSAAVSLHKDGVFPVTCGFHRNQTVVCCESEEQVAAHTISTLSERACQTYAKASTGVRTNIIGGDIVNKGEMPHLAALGFVRPGADSIFWNCGGSLISDRYILTAAHCFANHNWRLVTVRLGGVDLASDSEGALQEAVSVVTLHPNYRPPYNDIALVRLAMALAFSESLAPACLYTRPDLPRDALVVAGWGATDPLGDNKSRYLLKAVVLDMDIVECNGFHKENPMLRNGVVESMLCAYDPQREKDTCAGDSGGPLQALTANVSKVFSIIGVTSIGPTVCAGPLPSIYTKVSSYIPWIESIVWPREETT